MDKQTNTLITALMIIFIGWGQSTFAQQQTVTPAVTSFVMGGVTLQEDVKNPPVSSGMQQFEITFNSPVTIL